MLSISISTHSITMYCTPLRLVILLVVGSLLLQEVTSGGTLEQEVKELVTKYRIDLLFLQLKEYCHTISDKSTDYLGKAKEEVVKEKLKETLHSFIPNSESNNEDEKCSSLSQLSVEEGPCSSPSTVNLTEYWRKDGKGSQIEPYNGTAACDRELQGNSIWFRFGGDAGSQLSNRCRPDYSCGSHGGFWSDAEMPTKVGEIKFVPIYGSLRNNCNWYTWPSPNPLTVQRCSERPGDFVYKVKGTSECFWTFCGTDVGVGRK